MTEDKEPSANAVQVLHRDLSTQSQIGMLLAVSSSMMQFLSREVVDDSGDEYQPERDESHIAAENTLIRACERIEKILQDDRRWGLDFQIRLEALFEKNTKLAHGVAEQQKSLIEASRRREKAQEAAALRASLPHSVYRPALFSMPDHTWVAFLGDPADLRSGIMGVGESPASALASFDLAFSGQLTREQEQTIQSIQNEHKDLDQTGTDATGEDDQRRTDEPPSSRSAGA